MGKNPAFLFYPGDWFREPGLRMVPLYVKGAWAELLFSMFDCPEQGKISGNLADFGALLGVDPWGECEQHGTKVCHPWDCNGEAYEGSALDIIRQLITRRICDAEFVDEQIQEFFSLRDDENLSEDLPLSVTPRDFFVTLICRRMYREFRERQLHRNRQDKYRNKKRDGTMTQGSDGIVTSPLSVSSSVSVSVSSSKRKKEIPPLSPSRGKPSRRCPSDFQLTPELKDWAQVEYPSIDFMRETDKFKDYEFRNTHRDWTATWKNWIRTAYEKNGNGNRSKPNRMEELERLADEQEAEERKSRGVSGKNDSGLLPLSCDTRNKGNLP